MGNISELEQVHSEAVALFLMYDKDTARIFGANDAVIAAIKRVTLGIKYVENLASIPVEITRRISQDLRARTRTGLEADILNCLDSTDLATAKSHLERAKRKRLLG